MARTDTTLALNPGQDLSAYLRCVRNYPVLTLEEEQTFTRQYRDTQDQDAAHRVVSSHLRLVVKIALGYRGYGLPLADVVCEGNVGLMQALNKFDPDLGYRFATYAMWWIRASIQEYILHSWSLVKIGTTSAQKKLFFNLRKIKNQLNAYDEGDLSPEVTTTIAEKLNVAEHEVVNMNRRMSSSDHSINAPVRAGDQQDWEDFLADDTDSHEEEIAHQEEMSMRSNMLVQCLGILNDREKIIFESRRLKDTPTTLEDLSQKFGVSRERIRQIEMRAFDKVRAAMHEACDAMETQAEAACSAYAQA